MPLLPVPMFIQEGKATKHSFVQFYDIAAYPALLFFDAFGNMLNPAKRPDSDKGRSMITYD